MLVAQVDIPMKKTKCYVLFFYWCFEWKAVPVAHLAIKTNKWLCSAVEFHYYNAVSATRAVDVSVNQSINRSIYLSIYSQYLLLDVCLCSSSFVNAMMSLKPCRLEFDFTVRLLRATWTLVCLFYLSSQMSWTAAASVEAHLSPSMA